MKWFFILLLCSCANDKSEITVCPCTVTKVAKEQGRYQVTVQGRTTPGYDGYTADFTFYTTEPHQIGDIIR